MHTARYRFIATNIYSLVGCGLMACGDKENCEYSMWKEVPQLIATCERMLVYMIRSNIIKAYVRVFICVFIYDNSKECLLL